MVQLDFNMKKELGLKIFFLALAIPRSKIAVLKLLVRLQNAWRNLGEPMASLTA
jgi:hypothetical protein